MTEVGVTGSEGYIGEALIRRLVEGGESVVRYDVERGEDINDTECLERKFSGVDVVIHLAALSGVESCRRSPSQAIRDNIEGTISVADFCRKEEKRLIFPSSFAEDRDTVYGRTKKISAKYIQETCDDYLIFKKSNVYGGDKATVINYFIDEFHSGNALSVHSPGTQVRDFIHLSDVIDAYIGAINSDFSEKIQLVSGEVVTVREVAEMISDDVEVVPSPGNDEIYWLETDPSGLEKINATPDISLREGISMVKEEKNENV